MHPWHTLSTGQVLEQLRADPVSGLAVNEAAQRLQHYGPNQLKQPPQPSWALRFLNQVKDPMVLVLLAAAALSLLSSRGMRSSSWSSSWSTPASPSPKSPAPNVP